ncbi:MAG: hypothetical protein DRQ88_10830 [Epsilonproteobacteria bacterium]|nr:MAG: hypothetical protein DRQ89_07995 [Campylobacterota bacterium]RLA64490.1 MAG: hypothetical protein DRQ88_10830 [Campylobacterota bacterium]
MTFVLKTLFLFCTLFLSGIRAEVLFPLEKLNFGMELKDQILIAQGNNPVMDIKPLGDPIDPPKEEYLPAQDTLPFWGKETRERGYNLPLPMGVSLNYIYMKQGINFDDVMVTLGDEDMLIEGVSFDGPVRADNIGVMRADVWVLPFLNFYGIFGHLGGNITTEVGIPGDLTVTGDPMQVDADIEYNGFTYGFGIDVAGGYESMFVLIDSNFAWTSVDVSDAPITTFVFSPKIGIIIEDKDLIGRGTIWLGTMYLNFDMEVTGSIATAKISPDLPDILGVQSLGYTAKVSPIGTWNMLIGGSWEITPHWVFLAEVGFIKRTQYIMGGVYRF